MKFIAHITTIHNKHKLVKFDVPEDFFKNKDFNYKNSDGSTDYMKLVNSAGWYYMNKIDFENCIGPYEYCIMPIPLFENLNLAN